MFNHFWQNTQGIVFSTQWIFEHLPPSAINGDPKATFDPNFFWINMSYRHNNCIYLFKKYQPYWFMTDIVTFPTKYFFMKIWLQNLFLDKVLLCIQKEKRKKSGSVMGKLKAAAFQKTLELYHDQRIWGRNNCVNLDNAVLLPSKNALFALFWASNSFLP